jgi:hypothetical protein
VWLSTDCRTAANAGSASPVGHGVDIVSTNRNLKRWRHEAGKKHARRSIAILECLQLFGVLASPLVVCVQQLQAKEAFCL